MKVFPVAGRLVRYPQTRLSPTNDGLIVPDHDPFWLRRLRDGDVSLLSPADQAKAVEEAAAKKKAEADEANAQAELKAASAQTGENAS